MSGNRAEAQQAAEKAASIEPDLARTQTVVGFAALAGFKNDDAEDAFSRALAANSADPMRQRRISWTSSGPEYLSSFIFC